MTTLPPMCLGCVHRTAPGVCEAFPDGIPDDITLDGFDHRNPFPGDRGITFKPDPADPELVEVLLSGYTPPAPPTLDP